MLKMIRTGINAERTLEEFFAAVKKNKLTIIVSVFFFLGMIYGAVMIGFGDQELLHSLAFMTKGYLTDRAEQSMLDTFLNSLYTSGGMVVLLFLLGFSAVSIPAILFLPLFKGLGLGAAMGYLYLTYGIKGVAFSAVMILPAALLTTFAIILSGREATKLSLFFLAAFVPKLQGSLSARTVKLYCAKFLVLLGIVVIAGVVDCITAFLFSGFLIL